MRLKELARPDMGDLARWDDNVAMMGGWLETVDAAKGVYRVSTKAENGEIETTREFRVREPKKIATYLYIALSGLDREKAMYADQAIKIRFLNGLKDHRISTKHVNAIRNAAT